MVSHEERKKIIVTSFVLTLVIFIIAVLLNYGVDFFRINSITAVMQEHEIDTESYLVEQNFVNTFGGDRCGVMASRIIVLKDEMKEVGTELSTYGKLSIFNQKDFDYLKRKYFLLQLKTYTLAKQANDDCNASFVPILFFYRIDDDPSARQGYVLSDIGKDYPSKAVVLSFDVDYEDEPLLRLMMQNYNITEVPAMVIGDSALLSGLHYKAEIEAYLREGYEKGKEEADI